MFLQISFDMCAGVSCKSFRLMAIASGVIKDVHKLDFSRMTQQDVEDCTTDLQLLGLVVLTNSLRPKAKQIVRDVQDG